jgi:excisionase family DNA binding protein
MSYSLSQAAEACRVNRTTILRAIKQGKISATRDAHDHWQVDPAELHRVYPPADARSEGARDQAAAVTRQLADQSAKAAQPTRSWWWRKAG